MAWINGAPPLDDAHFHSPLPLISKKMAWKLAHSFGLHSGTHEQHRVSVVAFHPSLLSIRGMENVVEAVPEICDYYGLLTGHQMKSVIVVDGSVDYETPNRGKRIRIKKERCPAQAPPHIAFMDEREAARFVSYGTATLMILVKRGGLLNGMNQSIKSMAGAISSGRLEALLVVTDTITPRDEWKEAYNHYCRHRISIGYSQLRKDDVV